jgi:hypothetical protein
MTDIRERLLKLRGDYAGALVIQEAADEIERLHGIEVTGRKMWHEANTEIERLRAEVERITALGRDTLSSLETLGEDGWSEAPYLIKAWRRALENKP